MLELGNKVMKKLLTSTLLGDERLVPTKHNSIDELFSTDFATTR